MEERYLSDLSPEEWEEYKKYCEMLGKESEKNGTALPPMPDWKELLRKASLEARMTRAETFLDCLKPEARKRIMEMDLATWQEMVEKGIEPKKEDLK